MAENVTVETIVHAPREKVWELFTQPEHVTKWNQASPDWHTTRAGNNLVVGGVFNYRMEAKDGSAGFDFVGTYDDVVPNEKLAYTMDDGRKVTTTFIEDGGGIRITQTFEAETENTIEKQREGWQAILESFKKYVERK